MIISQAMQCICRQLSQAGQKTAALHKPAANPLTQASCDCRRCNIRVQAEGAQRHVINGRCAGPAQEITTARQRTSGCIFSSAASILLHASWKVCCLPLTLRC